MPQNLVINIQKPTSAHDTSSQLGNMCLNRLCIDEDAAFEVLEVHYQEEIDTRNISDNSSGKGILRLTVQVYSNL